jgi:hypothetical protein
MPHAAQSRSESCRGVSSFSENNLDDSLSLRASIRGLPPFLDGAGNGISCAFSMTGVIKELIIRTADNLINAFLITFLICG